MSICRVPLNRATIPREDRAEEKFSYFPAFVKVADRKVIVVGGGKMAAGKLRLLRRTEADIVVVAAGLCPDIRAMCDAGVIRHEAGPFMPAMLDGAALVFVADGEDVLTQRVRAAAKARNIPVNVVDQTEECDFITPAILDRAPVMVAISTSGCAPALARILRQRLEAAIPASVGPLAAIARNTRGMIAGLVPDGRRRNRFWTYFFRDNMRGVQPCDTGGSRPVVMDTLRRFVRQEGSGARRLEEYDIGETDPMRLAYGVIRAIETADIIYFDPRIPKQILAFARRDASLVEHPCQAPLTAVDRNVIPADTDAVAVYLNWVTK